MQGCSPCDFDCMGLLSCCWLLEVSSSFCSRSKVADRAVGALGDSRGGGAIYASAVVLPAKENNPRSPTHLKTCRIQQPSSWAVCHLRGFTPLEPPASAVAV